MKKCDHFKDLILTNYVDGELDKNSSGNIESHLLDCNDCRAFLNEVKNTATLPFQQTSRQPVPTALWDTIKQRIEDENRATSAFGELIDKLKGLFVFPKIVPVFASLVVMLLAGSITVNTIQVQQSQAKDQGEYLVSLLGATGPSASADSNDPGTPIEHYFL